MKKILSNINDEDISNAAPQDIHFLYQDAAQFYYKNREVDNNLNIVIDLLKKKILISEQVKIAMIKEYGVPLPSHYGYKQLSIIYEKNKNYSEALSLCKTALNEGWNGDWDKRITRLENKLSKIQ